MITARLLPSSIRSCTHGVVKSRYLSSQATVAVEKLRGALEEYRAINYTQELPLRFKKEIVKAAKKHDSPTPEDRIALDGLQRVISNIDMEHKVSRADMEAIFREIGVENGKMITTDRFMKML